MVRRREGPTATDRQDPRVIDLVDRLSPDFEATVPRPVLEACVANCLAQWADARIQDFVPILAERLARQRLAELQWRERHHGRDDPVDRRRTDGRA